jgi:two-component system response regulator WspF
VTRIAIIHRAAALADTLAGLLRSQPGLVVAWTSAETSSAIARCRTEPPDVVLLHAGSGPPGAVEATRQIVRSAPSLVIILTDARHADTAVVFEAMGAGAIDVVESPALSSTGQLEGIERLVRKVRAAASLSGAGLPSRVVGPEPAPPATSTSAAPLVVIGASTGGPSALVAVLGPLPATIDVPIVVVQHVDAQFSADLVAWLVQHVRLPVVTARRGHEPERGSVVLAATNDDLVMTAGRTFAFSRPRDGSFYHPSVDILFSSVAQHWPTPGVAVLLTGIGRDGAEGLLALRQRGWHTIAQDQATSVVYGMPRAAAEVGAAVEILPVGRIAAAVQRALAAYRPA